MNKIVEELLRKRIGMTVLRGYMRRLVTKIEIVLLIIQIPLMRPEILLRDPLKILLRDPLNLTIFTTYLIVRRPEILLRDPLKMRRIFLAYPVPEGKKTSRTTMTVTTMVMTRVAELTMASMTVTTMVVTKSIAVTMQMMKLITVTVTDPATVPVTIRVS